MADKSTSLIDRALGTNPNASIDLSSKPRRSENIIRASLWACGLLSILTTVGIIFVLSNDSIAFFTQPNWVETKRPILVDLEQDATVLQVETGLHGAEVGSLARVGSEVMTITDFAENTTSTAIVGTGGGFDRFCGVVTEDSRGNPIPQPHIANASRGIRQDEIQACQTIGRDPIGFRVGTDAIVIASNAENDFATDMTVEELAFLFTGAETWADIRPEWPAEPIARFIPGTDSGTFDFFVDEVLDGDSSVIVAEERVAAGEVITDEDDNKLVGSISRNPYAVGFFGYAYYLENTDALNAIHIDGVEPNITTTEDGSYVLARPLFLYSDAAIIQENPQVGQFISYYLQNATEVIVEVGYFPASDDALLTAQQTLQDILGVDVLETVDPLTVNGAIDTAGSSTVAPLTMRIAEEFESEGYNPRLTVERGANGTDVIPHRAGIQVELDDRPTLIEFFTNDTWIPSQGEFGVLPLLNATLMVSLIAMLVALPLGLGAAIYLSEYASPGVRGTLKPILEILAGIPTVVYGFFAVTFMTPLLQSIFGAGNVAVFNTASAGIVVGILIIPLVSSMSEDALHAVPQSLREASFGLGATKLETSIKVVLPAALSGILAAFIVAISRAVGETMIVALAAGAGPNFTFNVFESAETMTGHIVRISGGDISYGAIDYQSLFAIGLTLFVITFMLNLLSRWVINRFREAY